ncbi:MAG: type I DNA topoisomerase, partial [Mariprofundaceae bacterium]|nr:type I DNA topoisomerase [Mariprofundaceae bacterium]
IENALKRADTLILASDLDREGEAIAWHVADELESRGCLKDKAIQRITFHEITRQAIQQAIANPSQINMPLVDAQQARSALDYLVGFTLSPLLWRKVRSGLSAGRVQSVALRLICEREAHIREFKPKEYWTIHTDCRADTGSFTAQLHAMDGKTLTKFALDGSVAAKAASKRVEKSTFTVASVQKKQTKQQPAAPFITSTLQMEASRKLGFTARKTMQLAQRLYEGEEFDGERVGLISYMRTDSVSLSEESIGDMRDYIAEHFDAAYLPKQARHFKTKSKNAQEAHEAIRPTAISRTPERLKPVLEADAWRLYDLIWKRSLATQMAPALLDQVRADINGDALMLRASGSTMVFPGFRKLYIEGTDEPAKEDVQGLLPELKAGDAIAIDTVTPKQHFTEPKPRFSEATLVKDLESHGIGRPSTYASILNVLRERKYADMERKRFVPTEVGEIVNTFLTRYFNDVIDVNFTASVEDKLDAVARGDDDWKPLLREFWGPFKKQVDHTMENVSRSDVTHTETDEICDQCGKPMAIKLGRYGRFMACTGYPECKNAKPLNDGKEGEEQAEPEMSDQKCDKCGAGMVIKNGRYGKFLGCSAYPECRNIQPMEKPRDTGVSCPECNKGTFLEKKSRRGKVFYSCSCYPKCKNALWNPPVSRPCPACSAPFITQKTTKRRGTEWVCVNEACKWTAPVPEGEELPSET